MLPHNAHLDTRSAEELMFAIQADDSKEIDLAASKHFYEVPMDFDWDQITSAYEAEYEKRLREFSKVLGEPSYRGRWDASDFDEWNSVVPEYASAVELAVWKVGEKRLYLRYGWEDKEIPMIIALGMEGCEMTGIAYPGQFD